MFRIGQGYDVHRLLPGRRLVLGGVELDWHLGLDGHSDADVLLHALCDALLGAAGLGDLGQHFPPTAARYKDADSRVLLRAVARLLHQQDWQVENIDSTIIAQAPRLAGHIPRMQQNIATDLELDVHRVNVKATSTEGLGFEGEQQGIAAMAVVLLGTTRKD